MNMATSDHIESDTLEPCWHCGCLTYMIEVNFEARLHPGECTEAKWREYFNALAESDAAEVT